jgi:ubiquinone/menaquinone biosynthesis C-methylase UbiE
MKEFKKLDSKESIKEYFESTAYRRLTWKKRNRFYHRTLEKYFSFSIPEGSRVLEIGCGTGDLLAAVKPAFGVGIDFSGEMIEIASSRYPDLLFKKHDIEEVTFIDELEQSEQQFDYIMLSDLLHVLWDVQKGLNNLKKFCHPSTRIIISNYNFLWEPLFKFGELIGLKQRSPNSNWLSFNDIVNLLKIEGFQVISASQKLMLPKYIPLLNFVFNKIMVNLPLINNLGLTTIMTACLEKNARKDYGVSIVIPARNEKGNITNAITRTPLFGLSQEFVFVEGHSSDATYDEILRVCLEFPDKNIKVLKQQGKGKGDAVREGFEASTGDVLMILDADLTTPPEDLPKFYDAIANGKGEFINGCRLVYPMEKEAMRFLNLLGNKFFSVFFTYLLGQRLKDTLCGTKVLFKKDYEKIKANRSYFGDFDPFGDFDLLFGAAKLNLNIVEIIVRYKERQYGSTQISRFRHGLLLLRMSFFAAVKLKFR